MRTCRRAAGSQVRNSKKQTSFFDFKMPKWWVHRCQFGVVQLQNSTANLHTYSSKAV